MSIFDRLKHAWNAFQAYDQNTIPLGEPTVYNRVGSLHYTTKNRFAAPIFNKIAIDVAMTSFNHVVINKKNDDIKVQDSGLNYCLTVEANIDQTAVSFIYDLVFSLLDEGEVAIVPIETTLNPKETSGYDITKMRVGRIVGKTNKSVCIDVYNELEGRNRTIWLPKNMIAIIENPLYYVINEPNSTLQRLLQKMALVDASDNLYSSNRLDIILQAPQAIRTDAQIKQAKRRILEIDEQLRVGNNGVAYIDATEKITQLNRPANSQINETVKSLKKEFYNQLGLTESVFDGTATESELKNYYNRTIDPIILFVVKEMERKFLTKTARTQGHAIEFYRNTLKFVSAEQLISLGDAFRRNEILSSNEIRKLIGFNRSNEVSADKLANPNIADKNQMKSLGSAKKAEGESSEDIAKKKRIKETLANEK